MKKNLLISILAVLSISTIHASKTKTTEKSVAQTCINYVLDNKLKCAVVAVVASDVYINGLDGSIVAQGAQFLKNSGLQLYGNAIKTYTATTNTTEAVKGTISTTTDVVKDAISTTTDYVKNLFA